MRASMLALAVALGGCQLLIGIEDPVGDECSPYDIETCDLTDTCDVDPDDGRLTCRMEGTRQAGELCLELDDCAGPLSCVDGVCRTFCPVFGDDCGDPAEGLCLKQWGSTHVCDSECSVVAGDCANLETDCMLTTNDSGTPIALCVPQGYFGNVAPGQPCDFLANCEPGYACSPSEGICKELCELGPTCLGGEQCVAAFETVHGVQYGLCP